MAEIERKPTTAPGRKHRIARWPVLVLGVLVLLLLGLDAASPPILARAVQYGLRSAGFPEAQVGPAYVGWTHAVIEDIALDGGGLNRIHRAEAGLSLRALLAGKLESLTLDGVRLEIRPFGPGPILPGWVPQENSGATPGPLVLPVRTLRVRDIAVGFTTPAGPILAAAPEVAIDAGLDGLTASAPFRAEHAKWIVTGRATARLASGKGEARVVLSEAHLPDSKVAIEGFSGQAALGFETGQVTFLQAEARGGLRAARARGRFAFSRAAKRRMSICIGGRPRPRPTSRSSRRSRARRRASWRRSDSSPSIPHWPAFRPGVSTAGSRRTARRGRDGRTCA